MNLAMCLQRKEADKHVRMSRAAIAKGQRAHEVVLPKLFKICGDDFGQNKQEILAYYASFLADEQMEELIEVLLSF